ncbi:MAG: hypothetical protein IPO94_13965 [Saprospiraceae bacterium]|nr:hypothetical protein [Saprospiraceae bacterium]
MNYFKIILFLLISTFWSISGFAQNSNPVVVNMIPQAVDISYRNIDVVSLIKESKDAGVVSYSIHIYYMNGSKEISLVDLTEPRFNQYKYAQRAAETIIKKIKYDESLVLAGTDLTYIFQ